VIPGLHPWPTPLQALALVTSPRLRLRWNVFSFIEKSMGVEIFSHTFGSRYAIQILCLNITFWLKCNYKLYSSTFSLQLFCSLAKKVSEVGVYRAMLGMHVCFKSCFNFPC
jgi:hypothetical protein